MSSGGCWIELTADLQHRIADLFGRKPPAIEAPVVLVLRVLHGVRRVVAGCGRVGTRQHDLFVQLLQAPAAFDEARGQIIQQFGMRGHLTALAEIVRRIYQPAAEMPQPDAIHHHPRC